MVLEVFIICQVISDVSQVDCAKMLHEAITLAHAGQCLVYSNSKKKFFIVALYVDENMVVDIAMQTEGTSVESENEPVSDPG